MALSKRGRTKLDHDDISASASLHLDRPKQCTKLNCLFEFVSETFHRIDPRVALYLCNPHKRLFRRGSITSASTTSWFMNPSSPTLAR
eukprot:1157926-Amphidinium_carterae.1